MPMWRRLNFPVFVKLRVNLVILRVRLITFP
jgi:hypothetical protein